MKTLLLVGASGLVGSHVLQQALADDRVARVVAPARRPLAAQRKLDSPLVDFGHLPEEAPWWAVDSVICTLGTTIRVAGSQAAFRKVDYDYPLAVALLARRHGARAYALNSAMGANAASRIFYSRVKGELEQALIAQRFESLTLVRPGLLGGVRTEVRRGERVAIRALGAIGAWLPRRYRVVPPANVARVLLDAAIEQRAGVRVVHSDALV